MILNRQRISEEKRKRQREKNDSIIHDQFVEEKKYWMDKKVKAFNKKRELGVSDEKAGGKDNLFIFPTIASCTSSEEEEEEEKGKDEEEKDDLIKPEDEKVDYSHHHRRHHHRRRHHRRHHHSK